MTLILIDYIFLGACAIVGVLSAIKGFLKRLFSVLGVFVVSAGTAYLSQYPAQWLSGIVPDEFLTIASAIVTVVVLGLAYALLSKIIEGKITQIKGAKGIDVLLGFILGVFEVYLVGSFVFKVASEATGILQKLTDLLELKDSQLLQKVYENNFIGDWIVNTLITKIGG